MGAVQLSNPASGAPACRTAPAMRTSPPRPFKASAMCIELVRSIRTLRAELDVLAETQPELARARRDELEAPETLAYREEIERRRAAVRAARLNGHRIELEPVAVN